MIFFLLVLLSLFGSLVAQQFIPPLPWLHGARVLLLPIFFFYGALAFPFWAMLILAFAAGIMWDALTVQAIESYVEISLGWSILLYAAFGALMNGFRPWFQRGRWEVHCLVSGICTSFMVLIEFLMITVRRGGFLFPPEIWWRIGGAGLVAMALSPLVFFILNWFGKLTGYRGRPGVEPVL